MLIILADWRESHKATSKSHIPPGHSDNLPTELSVFPGLSRLPNIYPKAGAVGPSVMVPSAECPRDTAARHRADGSRIDKASPALNSASALPCNGFEICIDGLSLL